MSLKEILQFIKKSLKPKLELAKGTRMASLAFIALALLIATGALFAANTYYDLDTSQIVTEETQKATEWIKATTGLVVGTTTTPTSAKLQVTGGNLRVEKADGTKQFAVNSGSGTSTFAATTTFQNDAVWSDGSDIAGFDNAAGGNVVYSLPSDDTPPGSDLVLSTDGSGNLVWTSASSTLATSTVEGDITQVGDVTSGSAFTRDGSGNTLYFEGVADVNETALTAADPLTDATITIPSLWGTMAIQSGDLSGGSVAFLNSSGQLTENNTKFYWDDTNRRLGIRNNSPSHALDVSGQISGTELRFDDTTNSVVFQPGTGNATYTFPAGGQTTDYVLTTDGSGGLSWSDASGISGNVDGSGSANKVAMWTDPNTLATSSIEDYYSGVALTIGSAGTSTFATSVNVTGTLDADYLAGYTLAGDVTGASNDITGLGTITSDNATFTNAVSSGLFTSSGETTIGSADTQNIKLDPDSGVIKITGTIETAGGYQMGDTGSQRMVGMEPVLGYDYPVRCSNVCSSSFATITKTVTDYSFDSSPAGADRVHKLVINYADTIGDSLGSSTWKFVSVSGSNATFTVPNASSSSLSEEGQTFTTSALSDLSSGQQTSDWSKDGFPTGSDWHLEVRTNDGGASAAIQVNEVYLAAFDELQ